MATGSTQPPKQPPGHLPQQDRVRQGVTGQNVRYVLLFGTLGVIAAFVILGLYWAR